jgi:hypothetical protein
MGTEKLKFKLELYATMWDKPPHAEVWLNDLIFFNKDITGTEQNPSVIEFEHELEEGKEYSLRIDMSKKETSQTVIDNDGGIIKDQLLHIKNIEIDEIDIGALVYEGEYSPIYPEPWATQQRAKGVELPSNIKNVKTMGHNGQWRLNFVSPFYTWLLEHLY